MNLLRKYKRCRADSIAKRSNKTVFSWSSCKLRKVWTKILIKRTLSIDFKSSSVALRVRCTHYSIQSRCLRLYDKPRHRSAVWPFIVQFELIPLVTLSLTSLRGWTTWRLANSPFPDFRPRTPLPPFPARPVFNFFRLLHIVASYINSNCYSKTVINILFAKFRFCWNFRFNLLFERFLIFA